MIRSQTIGMACAIACLACPLARAMDTTFVIDDQLSSLTIEASTVFVIPLQDSDTQQLSGTIETTLDFGNDGSFPASAAITTNSAAISPLNAFDLQLGFPPLGVSVLVENAIATVTTPNPPASLTRTTNPLIEYEFDAANFDITLNQGNVAVSGAITDNLDLATMPVAGTAVPGTLGRITLTETATTSSAISVDALLELPIDFVEVVDLNGQAVTLDVDGQVVASSSFDIPIALAGDADNDGDIDGQDFLWYQSFDASQIPTWEAAYNSPPSNLAANSVVVPEPSSLFLLSLVGLAFANYR